ncbi:hypothetical protein PIGHUM_04057 [Pigmentiphaga humi]|uniref:Creatinase N-terminal domain-containing protein n=1 Tax=Pigmentiphaga humi TaxID=2478468 RepID=A0A3P4BA05_9BURK|nr:aminopeptidase P family N-terminal domain-containing protein [Pigmentiphaga humi]VCU71965.1 hypothetical protein PIGHUM_04057 [Pigmentiphaga humi]
MRRGLMSWSREELPASVLDERVARLQAGMKQEGLAAVLAYTSFAEPAAVHWLSNFTPYWSEAMLLVLPGEAPILLASLTPRVHGWIREVSHLGEVVSAPRLAQGVLETLAGKGVQRGSRIGVVGLDSLPAAVALPLMETWGAAAIVDAAPLFASLRQPCGKEALALADRALGIGLRAAAGVPADVRNTSELAAAVEASARAAGAEEVLYRVAPDLSRGGALRRLEGEFPLGPAYALELSVAYKGHWIRVGGSHAREARPAGWDAAQVWFADSLSRLAEHGADELAAAPGRESRWTLESCIGVQPLALARTHEQEFARLPPGSLAVFSAHAALDGGHWYQSAPLVLGGGQRGQALRG